MTKLSINSIKDIKTAIHENDRLHIQGNGTKTGLSLTDYPILDMSPVRGIIEYQPEEYTFTAYAATPVKEIQSALSKNGQYLPCDPLLVEAGATLGGTIATNLSGSRRFRYGGVRDFLLGATVIDAQGQLFRVGGKVVKNAAGFDLAKFLVGSLGHYMLMVDVTFKVFPDKTSFLTYQFDYATIEDALSAIFYLNQQPFELDALDIEVNHESSSLIARFAGLSETLSAQVKRFSSALNQHSNVQTMTQLEDVPYWQNINAMNHADKMLKIPIAPKQIPALDGYLHTIPRRYSVAGNIAWIQSDNIEELSPILTELNLSGLQILGNSGNPIIGKSIDNTFAQRVKAVLDPQNKFI